MKLHPMSEKFEAWLHGDELLLARAHMEAARIRKKAEYTRAAILAGRPRHDFERDWQTGALALAVNRLGVIMAAGGGNDEVGRVLGTVKRLTKALQQERAQSGRGQEWRQ